MHNVIQEPNMEIVDGLWACDECGYFIANGPPDEPDEGWDATECGKEWPDFVPVNGHYAPEDGDADPEGSADQWADCDLCGRRLHFGARMRPVHVYRLIDAAHPRIFAR